jgi:hypothetical protein
VPSIQTFISSLRHSISSRSSSSFACLRVSRLHFTTNMTIHQNGGSSTCVVEPESVELQDVSIHFKQPSKTYQPNSTRTSLNIQKVRSLKEDPQQDDPVQNLPSPTTASEKLERWNHPRTNLFRTLAAFWGFVVMGSNDAAYGVCHVFLPLDGLDADDILTGFDTICISPQ